MFESDLLNLMVVVQLGSTPLHSTAQKRILVPRSSVLHFLRLSKAAKADAPGRGGPPQKGPRSGGGPTGKAAKVGGSRGPQSKTEPL